MKAKEDGSGKKNSINRSCGQLAEICMFVQPFHFI